MVGATNARVDIVDTTVTRQGVGLERGFRDHFVS